MIDPEIKICVHDKNTSRPDLEINRRNANFDESRVLIHYVTLCSPSSRSYSCCRLAVIATLSSNTLQTPSQTTSLCYRNYRNNSVEAHCAERQMGWREDYNFVRTITLIRQSIFRTTTNTCYDRRPTSELKPGGFNLTDIAPHGQQRAKKS